MLAKDSNVDDHENFNKYKKPFLMLNSNRPFQKQTILCQFSLAALSNISFMFNPCLSKI